MGSFFGSNEEFFQAVRELASRLERQGHVRAAADLRDGFSLLNGLTDGAALFLQALERVDSHSRSFPAEDREILKRLHQAVRAAVTRG